MAWYSTGTADFTNSSATVTGTGTNWMPPNAQVGDAIHAPDGAVYEITAIVSATEITIAPAYQATTAAGAAYRIQPTRGVLSDVLSRLDTLLANYQGGVDGVLAGRFPDGDAVTPALRFLSDSGTGLFFKALGQLGIATGGVERGYIDQNGELQGGLVQTDSLDGTSGRLMKTGAFGLGAVAPYLENWSVEDNSIAPGFYRYDAIAQSSTGGPTAVTRGLGGHIRRASGGGEAQFLICENTSDSSQALLGEFFTRRRVTGSWSVWKRGLTYDRILGTVNESGGVPTGTIFETDTNANGEYVRYADGTQIAWNSNAAITTTPAAFTGTITKIDGDKLWIGRWF